MEKWLPSFLCEVSEGVYETDIRKDLSVSPAFGQLFLILSAGFG